MKKTLLTVLSACSVGAALCLTMAPTSASAISVALELSLVVDESGSVDNAEWLLQRDGYVTAFQSLAVQSAIAEIVNGGGGGIAVNYIQFAAGRQLGIGWTLINSAASANAFATSIQGLARFGSGGTGVARAITFASGLFGTEVGNAGNGFESVRQVIDVSGDGAENQGGNTDAASTAAITAGIDRINGIVISPNGEAGLLAFYQTQVQDGAGSFTLVANTFQDFAGAVETKIRAEITNTNPLPDGGSSLALLGLATLALACVKRNLKKV